MKKQIEKVKDFVGKHSNVLASGAVIGCTMTLGIVIGRWSMIPKARYILGAGILTGVEYAKVNGVETAEKAIATACKAAKSLKYI